MAANEIPLTSESISARSVRLNQLFVGKSSTMLPNQQQFLTKEALLDALFVLYEETQQESIKKDKNVAVFVEKFRTVMTTLKKMRVNVGDFEVKKVIGRGHFGDVQVVREKQTGNVYAMKVLRKTDTLSQQNVAFYDEERDIMAKANSPWITQLQYAFQDTANLYFVMEFHPGGDLLSLLDRYDNVFSEDMARFYLAEIALGIHALHGMGYVHRDIKPDNILIDRTGHVKLADFGSAAKLSKYDTVSSKMPVGTPDYIAPEVLASIEGKKGSYGRSCDWWSLGIVAYEMLCGKTPFSDEKVLVTYSNIMNHNKTLKYDSGFEVSDMAKELIAGLLSETIRRFDYEQICRHSFFETINWEGIRDSVPPFVPIVIGQDDTSNFEEYEIIAPKVEIPSVSKSGVFSGKNLPFIGFTHTKYAEISTDCSILRSPSQKSVINLESQLQAKKEEIKELRKRIECYEKQDCRSRAELAKATLQVKEQEKTKLLAERECERLCKDLMTAKGEAASLRRLIELERAERLKMEKDALQLLEGVKEKWKNAEKLKLDQLKQENDSLKEFLRELESKYREAKLMTLTLKNELSSALKMSENASVKVQHYKDKLRRSSTGDALQMEVVRQQLAFAEGQLEEVKAEKVSLESRLSALTEKANEQQQKLKTLEDALLEARNENARNENRLRMDLNDTKDALDIASDKLADMTTDLMLNNEQVELLKGRLEEATSSHQECVQQHLQELMRMHDLGENDNRPSTRQSFRKSKLVAKLQEQEAELQRLKDENACLQDNLMTARDSDSDKTQTVEELRAVVGRLEDGLKKLERGKVESDQIHDHVDGKVCFEAQVAKLEAQLEKCREANSKEKEATRQLHTELFKKERELRDAKIDNRIANRELKSVSEQLAGFHEKESKCEEDRKKLETELSSLKSEVTSVKRELEIKSKTFEKKESDWEREKIRLTEKVNALQSTCHELKDIQTKLGVAEGLAKQAEKHLKNLEEQVRAAEEDKRRAHTQEDQLHSDYKKLKMERDVLQKNLDTMKQVCTTMDGQLKDYETLVEVNEVEEARLKEELGVLQKTIVSMREEVKAANNAAVSEKSRMEASKMEAADLVRRSEIAEVIRDSELQGVLEQKNEYRSMVAALTEQVVQLENELVADKNEVMASRLKADKLNEEVVRIKEEAAQLITQIHSLKDTNFKLSRGLEEAIEKCTAAKERNVDLENTIQEIRIGHNIERVKMEETISQQSKLINFLQIKTEAMQKKKKTLTEKLFGRSGASSSDQQLQLSPTFNKGVHKTSYTIGRHKDAILEFSKHGNDQSKDMLNILAKSPGLQESPDRPPSERGIPKPSSERMQHRIPHRFQTGLNMHPTKCAACLDSIHFGRNISRCQECRICAHPKCASSLPNACNLPYDLMQHFRHSMRYRKGKEVTISNGNKDSNANSQGSLEGWLKMPRNGIQGWGRHFVRLEGTTLYLYDTDKIVSNTRPTDTLQLCPLDGTCKVTEAVLATEMAATAKSDLPYIFKVTTRPLTTCFPGRCVYFMADNFQDKLQWVAALERTLKANCASDTVEEESFGSLLFSIEDGANVDLNCIAYIDQDTVLCGSDDGLYIVDLLEEQGLNPKRHITIFGGVYQMSVEDSIGILILICGNERQLNWMRLSDVRSLVDGSATFAASQLTMLHLVDSVNSCHLFVASVREDSTFLCAATTNRVILLKWNAVMKTFCIRKELACSESCSCVLFTDNSVIVGTDKFYEIDLRNFVVEDFLDDSDPSLAHAVHGAPEIHSFPMAIFQVSPNGIEEEYLLCFYEFGIFVNAFGQRSRKRDMKWSRLPLKFVFRWPYLYVVHFYSIEVCEIIVHKEKCFSVQTFVNVSSPRYLGPSTDSGTMVVAVVKDGQANIFSFNGETSIKRKASKSDGNEIMEAVESESSNSEGDLQFSFSSSVMEALQQDDNDGGDDNHRESEV